MRCGRLVCREAHRKLCTAAQLHSGLQELIIRLHTQHAAPNATPQVFFSKHNPVFARGLSPLMRWMYGEAGSKQLQGRSMLLWACCCGTGS